MKDIGQKGKRGISGHDALTLLEMVIAMAIMAVVMAAILPQFRNIQNSWAVKQAGSEMLQNGRVLSDHIRNNLTKAVKITAVSNPSVTTGFIEFEASDGKTYRYDISGTKYVQYGVVGALGDLAGPVSSLQFTCYGLNDLDYPLTNTDLIRMVKVDTTLTNSAALGQDKTFTSRVFLRTNGSRVLGLIGGWELDETKGLTAADSSGKGNDGTLMRMAGNEWTTGIFGGALDFDGYNDYILAPISADYATSLTFSAWFKSDDAGSIGNNYLTQRFISQPRSDWYSRIALGINSNKIGAFWHDGGHNVGEGTTTLLPDVWYHAALTYDSSTIRIYLDGVEENSFSESHLTAPTSSYTMQIGRQISGERCLDGCLDRVRIYDRVLSPAEIAALAKVLKCSEFTEAKAASDTTSLIISTPPGAQEDDLLIAAVATDGNTKSSLAPPGGQGWTEIDIEDQSSDVTLGAWWKNVDASEPATHQFTWSGDEQAYGWIMRFVGHRISDPIDVDEKKGESSSSPTSPSVKTSVDDAVILRLGAFDNSDIIRDNPGLAGHTVITMDSSDSTGMGQVLYEQFTERKRPSGSTSVIINKPSGTSAGDLLIAAVVTDGDTKSSMSPPGGEGWTLISLQNKSNDVTLGVWWKLAGASESPTHQFTWSGSQEAYGWIMRFTGHDPTTPIHKRASNGGASSSPDCSSVTTTIANCMIVRIGGFDDDDVSVDSPGLSGHTAITMDESSSGWWGTCSGGAGYKQQPAIGSSGISKFALYGYEQYRTVTIAIAPATGGGGGGGSVSGGAGYIRQSSRGNSGTSTFSLTASQESQMITIGIAPEPDPGGGSSEFLP